MQKQADQALIERCYLQKWSLAEIAAEIARQRPYCLSPMQVCLDLKKIKARLAAEWRMTKDNMRTWFVKELAGLGQQEAELWHSWEASKQNAVMSCREPGKRGRLVKTKEIITSRVGDPQFMHLLLKVRERRCALLGLDKPVAVDMTVAAPDGGPVRVEHSVRLRPQRLMELLEYEMGQRQGEAEGAVVDMEQVPVLPAPPPEAPAQEPVNGKEVQGSGL